ncbi:MAG TPA: hypothetical protein ENJ83_04950 [Rhodospirillales bacterium]|nr:hypothetical protein [Rhodospirillales bacterium]
MLEPAAIGLDLDDVDQRAMPSCTGWPLTLPAVHVVLPTDTARRARSRALDLPAGFAEPALALARADALQLVRPEIYDTFATWRELGAREVDQQRREALRAQVRELLVRIGASRDSRIVVAIPDPVSEEAQERWLRALAGIGRVQLVWRPVLTALGFIQRGPDLRRELPFTLVAVELGWGVLRANVLEVELDEKAGLAVPERRRPGVETDWCGLDPPGVVRRLGLRWMRDGSGRLARARVADPETAPSVAGEIEEATVELAKKLAERLADARRVLWLVEGPLAAVHCGHGRLGGAVVRGLRRYLPEPRCIELVEGKAALVAAGAAECARRLAAGVPAWWDALPQLEINRVDQRGVVAFVPLVDAPRIAGGNTYTHEVRGVALPAGAETMHFVLFHGPHPTARRLVQPLAQRLPMEIEVKLVVRQQPAQGRARVDVVPLKPTPHFRPVKLDWDLLEDTRWDRETALRNLQQRVGLRYPPKTPVPAGLYHWYETRLPSVLRRFLRRSPDASFEYDAVVRECLHALRAVRPPGRAERTAAVSSDGELHPGLREDERELFERFGAKLDTDMRALPHGSDVRRRLAVVGAWLYAAAPLAVQEDLRLSLKRREYRQGLVQAAGRCFADEREIRLFFARCAEVCRGEEQNTDWMKALGQILIYREEACRWLDDGKVRLCLYGAVRELERALDGRPKPRPQIFNNAVLALLGLLRYRRQRPGFLLGRHDDPIPSDARLAIRERLAELVCRLDRHDPGPAAKIREVIRFLEGKGTDQLIAASFDE